MQRIVGHSRRISEFTKILKCFSTSLTQHKYDSEEDTSPSPCFCLGGEMMFLINSANIETAVITDTFEGVLPAAGDPGEWPGWIMGGWREYWCGNDINGAVLLQLMETCSSPPAPDTDKLSCTALHAGTCTGRWWSHPGADPIFRKQNTHIKLP